MKTIQVNSSRGTFTIDAATGGVISRTLDDEASIECQRIYPFALKEWRGQLGIDLPHHPGPLRPALLSPPLPHHHHAPPPPSWFRDDLIKQDPVIALRRARRLVWDADGSICAAIILLECHDRLNGDRVALVTLQRAAIALTARLCNRIDQLMDEVNEDQPLPADYDPGNDLGDLGADFNHPSSADSQAAAAFIRVQQYIVQLQAQVEERRAERAADARDLNVVAAKLWPDDTAGPEHQAIQRLGRRLCGDTLGDGSEDTPPVWE